MQDLIKSHKPQLLIGTTLETSQWFYADSEIIWNMTELFQIDEEGLDECSVYDFNVGYTLEDYPNISKAISCSLVIDIYDVEYFSEVLDKIRTSSEEDLQKIDCALSIMSLDCPKEKYYEKFIDAYENNDETSLIDEHESIEYAKDIMYQNIDSEDPYLIGLLESHFDFEGYRNNLLSDYVYFDNFRIYVSIPWY